MNNRPKIILCDLDGVLVKHSLPSECSKPSYKLKLLPKTIEKLTEWEAKGCYIIIMTGRKESLRSVTIKQLSEVGIFFDQLIMGFGGGERILINDKKSDGTISSKCFNPDRNYGIRDIEL